MLIKPDCILCILKVSISAIRRFMSDEKKIKELFSNILEIPSLRGLHWDTTSSEVLELVLEKIVDALDNTDPFHSLKVQQNQEKGWNFIPG